MNPSDVLITVLSLAAIPLALLLFGSWLIEYHARRNLATSEPAHRFIRDLRPLEDALVEFFASSKASSAILNALEKNRKPIGYKSLLRDMRAEEERRGTQDDASIHAFRAVLSILQVARLVRMSLDGIAITDTGREVHRRMQPDEPSRSPSSKHAGATVGSGEDKHRARLVRPLSASFESSQSLALFAKRTPRNPAPSLSVN